MSFFLRLTLIIVIIVGIVASVALFMPEVAYQTVGITDTDTVLIVNVIDDKHDLSVSDITVILYDKFENIIDITSTNHIGKAKFENLKKGQTYFIKSFAYKFYHEAVLEIRMTENNMSVRFPLTTSDFVETDLVGHEVDIVKVDLPVKIMYQTPTLPNGCEITSLAALMMYNGVDVAKEQLSDDYLKKTPITFKGGAMHSGDPSEGFVGNPRDDNGWYVYEQPIIDAGNNYFLDNNLNLEVAEAENLYEDRIENLLLSEIPVAVWTTLDYTAPTEWGGWYLEDGSFYSSITNVHCVVIYGYDDNYFYTMNPLEGYQKVSKDLLLSSVEAMGNRGVYIKKAH